jgi:hypothetical protein
MMAKGTMGSPRDSRKDRSAYEDIPDHQSAQHMGL